MTAMVRSVGLTGIDGHIVEVEVTTQGGLPGFDVVGLPASSIREARLRVKSALKALGFIWPKDRLIANLAPADVPKRGTGYDLALAMGVVAYDGQLPASIKDIVFFAEVGLDGGLRPVAGVINAAVAAREAGARAIVVAGQDVVEAALVKGVDIYGAMDIAHVVEALWGREQWLPVTRVDSVEHQWSGLDLSYIRGQLAARRALEVAAAGGHNLMLVGPPGCGKTLLARALPGILPPSSPERVIESMRVHSAAGLSLKRRGGLRAAMGRPFRAPHSTCSYAAMVGGGVPVRPGEVSLAHGGVLFLDEAAEFNRQTLDALRGPLEDRSVYVSRAGEKTSFPASFSLILAANPCPCGHLGDPMRPCRCPQSKLDAYRQRLSGPLMDRVDLRVRLSAVPVDELHKKPRGEPTSAVAARVRAAREMQRRRNFSGGRVTNNAELDVAQVDAWIRLGDVEAAYLAKTCRRLGVTARGWHRILRVARTIADLAGDEAVTRIHLAEALTYRISLFGEPKVRPRGISNDASASGPRWSRPRGRQNSAPAERSER